jgi:hypothetical protein
VKRVAVTADLHHGLLGTVLRPFSADDDLLGDMLEERS